MVVCSFHSIEWTTSVICMWYIFLCDSITRMRMWNYTYLKNKEKRKINEHYVVCIFIENYNIWNGQRRNWKKKNFSLVSSTAIRVFVDFYDLERNVMNMYCLDGTLTRWNLKANRIVIIKEYFIYFHFYLSFSLYFVFYILLFVANLLNKTKTILFAVYLFMLLVF